MASLEDPGYKYEGYIIEMDVDVRDVLGTKGDESKNIAPRPPFPFVHRVYRTDQTLVTAPLLDYGERNDLELRMDMLKRQDQARTVKDRREDVNAPDNQDSRPIYEALSDSLNKFVDRHNKFGDAGEDLQAWQSATMHYILKFPAGVQLKGEVLECNKGKKNLELKATGQMYFAPVDKVGRKLTVNPTGMEMEVDTTAEVFKGKLIWMVADLNQRQRKLTKLSAAEVAAQTDAAAALLESMGLS